MKIKKEHNRYRVVYRENGKLTAASFGTEQEAKVFVAAREVLKGSKTRPPDSTATPDLEKLISTYVDFTLGNKREHTRKNVTSVLRQALPNVNWRNPDKADLFAYCVKRKYKSSTAKGHLKWVKSFCMFNNVDTSKVDWKRLNQALSKEDKKEKNYLTADDFAKLIAGVPPKYSIIYRYMGACGIRVRELTRLDKEDFTPATWTVRLPAHKAKAKKLRTFEVPHELRKDFIEHTTKSVDPKAPLFHHDGIRISANGLANIFKTQCDKVGIGNRNIHLLRAFAIPNILRACGNNFELVRNICGWDSQEMQKYTGLMEGDKAELASNFSFSQSQIDSTREMDVLVSSLNGLLIEEGEDPTEVYKSLSAKTGVSYAWIFNILQNKKSQDVENLLKVIKYLEHKLEVFADKTKKRKSS